MIMPLTHHEQFHQKTDFVGHNLYKHPTLNKKPAEGSASGGREWEGKSRARSTEWLWVQMLAMPASEGPPWGIALAIAAR